MKTNFIAVAYHEMRTPLASIIGYTSLLEQSELTGKQKNYVRIIEESATQLNDLIDGMLEVTRIEAGGVKLRLDEISIQEIVKSVVERFKPQTDEKKPKVFIYSYAYT